MIRSFLPADERFVHSSWMRSYSQSPWARLCTAPPEWEANGHGGAVYFDGMRALMPRLIATSVTFVDVAEDTLIDGWACGWPGEVLHYVYVRLGSRKLGVARQLLEALDLRAGARVRCSHLNPIIRLPKGWTFDPYVLTIGDRHGNQASQVHRVQRA